jgi:hypothetical protein
VIYQLRWKILPGLRGLSCSEFRGAPTSAPDQDQGVAVAFASEAERDAFLQQLEEHFLGQRFSNQAAAFEAVKTYVLEWNARRV